MSNDATNVFLSDSAAVAVKIGAKDINSWPETTDEALDNGFEFLGFTSVDGFSISRTVETSAIDAHQSKAIRYTVSGGSDTISITALETNPVVEKLYWGSDVEAGTPNKRVVKQAKAYNVNIVINTADTQDGYEKEQRIVAYGLLTPNGDITDSPTGTGRQYPFLLSIQGDFWVLSDEDADS